MGTYETEIWVGLLEDKLDRLIFPGIKSALSGYWPCLHALYRLCCIAQVAARCICCCFAQHISAGKDVPTNICTYVRKDLGREKRFSKFSFSDQESDYSNPRRDFEVWSISLSTIELTVRKEKEEEHLKIATCWGWYNTPTPRKDFCSSRMKI